MSAGKDIRALEDLRSFITDTMSQHGVIGQREWHNGLVTGILSGTLLEVRVNGSNLRQKIPCNPDIDFSVGDEVSVHRVNNDTKNQYVPYKRGLSKNSSGGVDARLEIRVLQSTLEIFESEYRQIDAQYTSNVDDVNLSLPVKNELVLAKEGYDIALDEVRGAINEIIAQGTISEDEKERVDALVLAYKVSFTQVFNALEKAIEDIFNNMLEIIEDNAKDYTDKTKDELAEEMANKVDQLIYDADKDLIESEIEARLKLDDFAQEKHALENKISDKLDEIDYNEDQLLIDATLREKLNREEFEIEKDSILSTLGDEIEEIDGKLVHKADKDGVYTKEETDEAFSNYVAVIEYETDQEGVIERLTSNESTIEQLEDEISSTVKRTEFNELEDTVSSHTSSITQLADKIESKVDSSVIDDINNTITDQGTAITQLEDSITNTVTKDEYSKDLDDMSTTISEAESRIEQRVDEISLSVEETENYVRSELAPALDDKVDQSVYTEKMASIDVTLDDITSSVSSTNKTVGEHGEELELLDSRVEQTAESITSTIERVEANEDSISSAQAVIEQHADMIEQRVTKTEFDEGIDGLEIGGRNLFEGGELPKYTGISDRAEHMYYANIDHVFDKLSIGDEITISFDVEMEKGEFLQVYNNNRRNEIWFSPNKTFRDIGTKKTRLNFTTYVAETSATSGYGTVIEFYSTYGTEDWFTISNLQIEKGNKATDWSPAPEDIDAELDRLGNTITSYETRITQTEEAITLAATKEELSDTADSMRTQMAEIDVKADGIIQTVSDVQAEFDDMEIGGRNLVLKSKGEYEYNLVMTYLDVVEIMESNTEYTISFEAKTSNGTDEMYMSTVSPLNSGNTFQRIVNSTPTTEYKRYTFHFTAIDDSETVHRLMINNRVSNNPNNTGILYIRNIKLEKGNKATDWSPAPEDVQSQIDDIGSTLTQHNTAIEQNAQAIELKANSNEVYTQGETDTKISDAEASILVEAEKISQRVARTEVEEIVEGGRNLISHDPDDWMTVIMAHLLDGRIALSPNTTYTASDHSVPEATYSSFLYVYDADGEETRELDLGTNRTFTTTSNEVWAYPMVIVDDSSFTSKLGTTYKLQLELGNSATEWDGTPRGINTRFSNVESLIEQNADAITSKVSNTDYNGNRLVSMIEQTAASITLSASKINFNGHVFGQGATFTGEIVGGSIRSNSTIDVTTNLTVGNNIYVGNQSSTAWKYLRFNSTHSISSNGSHTEIRGLGLNVYNRSTSFTDSGTGNIKLRIQPTSVTVPHGDFKVSSGRFVGAGSNTMDLTSDSKSSFMRHLPTYYRTYTSTSQMMRVTVNGVFGRSTSSRRYKLLEEPLSLDYAKRIHDLDAKSWFDKRAVEEYVHTLETGEETEIQEVVRIGGFIAEDVHDVGLEMYVNYDDEDRPDGLHANLWAPLVPISRDHEERIEWLETENDFLKQSRSHMETVMTEQSEQISKLVSEMQELRELIA